MPLFKKRGGAYGASLGTGSVASGRWRRSKRAATAAANARAIAKNQRKINKLIKNETVYTTYQAKLEDLALGHQKTWWITNPPGWTKVFGPPPGDLPIMQKVELDMMIIPANEPSAVTFTVYVVSLRPETMSQLTENKGPGLVTLDQGTHYTDVAHGILHAGQVALNPQFFKIHKSYRFTKGQELAGDGSTIQRSLSGSVWRASCVLYPNKLLKNGRGDFDPASTSTFDDKAQLYVLAFSDNSTVDAQSPTLTVNASITLKS